MHPSAESLRARRDAVLGLVLAHVDARAPLLVLQAPPGSGKTYTILRAVALAFHRGQRVAIATQTNAQADDLCRRLAQDFPRIPVTRFASSRLEESELGVSLTWCSKGSEPPGGRSVVVATTAKWSTTSDVGEPYDVLFADEAWQMTWADFMHLGRVAARFVLVGDPGQIEPVVAVDTARWETAARPPHRPAPAVILRDRELPARVLSLPVSTRLPHDTVELVRAFYDFHFDAWAPPGARRLGVEGARPGKSTGADGAIDLLTCGSVALLALPTPDEGLALDDDRELAETAARVVRRLLERGAVARTEDGAARLRAEDIGMVATHRVMNGRLAEALGPLAASVRVDTPERWQGLERKVMVAVHPLSGVVNPTTFDLATGRLCVMASRHQVGLVLVSRDHVGKSLEEFVPVADQAVGAPDESGRGHAQHAAVWKWLHANGRVVRGG